MPIYHLFLVLSVVVIWGLNFIFVKLSLNEISPLLLCAIRFFLASFPAVFFIKPPATSFKLILLYGMFMFGLQFSLLFMGMYAGMPPGLASILVQVQVFFSIFMAGIFLGEFPSFWQILGALVSFTGIAVVAFHLDHTATLSGFLLIMGAAAAWGFGNLITKRIGHVNMIALVVWGSLVACLPLLLLSLIFEGPANFVHCFRDLTWVGGISVLYIVYLSTWVGYGLWNWLINHYNVASIAPFTLLVPFVAMFSSLIFLHESFALWKLEAGLLVIIGLCINFLAPRFINRGKLALKRN
jgi:O-acetylserine/cysteine efflux transporter